MRQTVLLICIALCVAAASAADDAQVASLMRSLYPSKASTMSGDYGVEKDAVCFKTLKTCFKGTGTSPETSLRPQTLVCTDCAEEHYGSSYGNHGADLDFKADITPALSKCNWNMVEFAYNAVNAGCVPLTSTTPGLNWCGTYSGQCILAAEETGRCNLPGAHEDTVVDVTGQIYYVNEAVKVGPPSSITDAVCTSSFTQQQATTSGPASAAADTQAKVQNKAEDDPMVKVNSAWVYHGSFNVVGIHPLKVNTGIHQHIAFDQNKTEQDKKLSQTTELPRLVNWSNRFEFGVPHGPHKHPY